MQIGNHRCSKQGATLLIAEEGQANQGDFNLALKMIDLAVLCGADGIEFQLAIAADLYVSADDGFQLYKKREFTSSAIRELIATTHAKGLLFQAACLSDRLVDSVVKLGADVLVVNAMDLNNPRMLDVVAVCGAPFFISTLMGTIEEIDWAVSRVRAHGANNFGLLHGQHIMASHYGVGVPIEYTQLDCISMLEQRYGLPIGFVDHTDSEIMPAIAASRGAVLVTKHLSPMEGWQGPDWQVCLDPDAWMRAGNYMRYANATRGSDKTLSLEEVSDRSCQRRSIIAARDIPAGKMLEEPDITFKRPGGGLDPRQVDKYLGRRVNRFVLADQPLTEEVMDI
ncbi:N-acetylneuraminate synthase family protein [Chloroflexota bacterium]